MEDEFGNYLDVSSFSQIVVLCRNLSRGTEEIQISGYPVSKAKIFYLNKFKIYIIFIYIYVQIAQSV